MAQLNEREKRLIRWALILLPAYLVIFYGLSGVRALEAQRQSYRELQLAAQDVQLQITKELKKRKRLRKLQEEWQLDLQDLDGDQVLMRARESIRSAAAQCGVALGNSSEVDRGSNSEESRNINFQATGATSSLLRFLHACPRLGIPVRLDNLQVKGLPGKPGKLTATFSVALINVDRWKKGKTNA